MGSKEKNNYGCGCGWDASYYLLSKWMNVLLVINLGTKVAWEITPFGNYNGNVRFKILFWAFGVVIEGFKNCRSIIQIDGTFLYGKYIGKLLIATSIDPTGHLFSLLFVVVKEKIIDN